MPDPFDLIAGIVEVAERTAASSVTFSLDAASFDTGHEKRDIHIRSEDFIDCGAHPIIDFWSTNITEAPAGYHVSGRLATCGVASDVTFVVHDVEAAGDSAYFSAPAMLERRDLGHSKPPALMISNNVNVNVSGTATRS